MAINSLRKLVDEDIKENPRKSGNSERGLKKTILNLTILFPLQNQLEKDAAEVSDVLIRLQREFPLFFRDIRPDDPDLDLERSFKAYEKMMRKEDAS